MQKRTAKKFLSKIRYLNSGGCLVSAYAFQQFCIKNGFEVPHLVALHYKSETKSIETNKKFIENKGSGKGQSAAHFGYSYGKQVYDSDGVIYTQKYDEKIRIPLELSKSFYETSMTNGGWNTMFNRGNIPVIAEKFGVDLSF